MAAGVAQDAFEAGAPTAMDWKNASDGEVAAWAALGNADAARELLARPADQPPSQDAVAAGIDTHPGGDPSIVEMLDFVQAAAGHDVTPGHDELHHYWTRDPRGLAKWVDSPKPWTTLVAHLTKYVGPAKAKVFASRWFIEVFGYAAGSDKNRVAHGHPPRGHVVGPG